MFITSIISIGSSIITDDQHQFFSLFSPYPYPYLSSNAPVYYNLKYLASAAVSESVFSHLLICSIISIRSIITISSIIRISISLFRSSSINITFSIFLYAHLPICLPSHHQQYHQHLYLHLYQQLQ